MKTFALIDDGSIRETLDLASNQDIYTFFPSSMVWVEITGMSPMPKQRWTYASGVFSPYAPPAPTEAELMAAASLKLQQATQLATTQKTALASRVGVLNDAIELEMATSNEKSELPVRVAQLAAWKKYAILLGRVTAQQGWFQMVGWPEQPAEGMDVAGSSVST